MSLDPTTVRVSDTTLLSDFVGCDSVYRYGYANPVNWDKRSAYFAEARLLGDKLDQIQEELGPVSISYGYVCPELSAKIVKYQNPHQPSYHRWDKGAACDITFHEFNDAPIYAAHAIDANVAYSRMITYSESEWICFGTQCCEGKSPRMAFYENQYLGKGHKPKFVKYSEHSMKRKQQKDEHKLPVKDWSGQGYPSYHGGGRQQLHHIRVGDYTVLSDLLYVAKYVHDGVKNLPPMTRGYDNFIEHAYSAGHAIAIAVEQTGARVSVVRGYDHAQPWHEGKRFIELVLRNGAIYEDTADALRAKDFEVSVRNTKSGMKRVRVYV